MSADKSIIELLAQDARVQRRARMLPTDRPLTPDEINNVARDFRAWADEKKIAAGRVSKDLGEGYSPATISQFLNGNARGDMERIARGLNEYMERRSAAVEVSLPTNFVETAVARQILQVVRTTILAAGSGEEARGTFGLVRGPGGTGKTMTLVAAQRVFTGAIYHRITGASKRGPGLLYSLAQVIGVPSRASRAINQILLIGRLRATGRPLLIDEAHQMTHDGLEQLRDIVDEAGLPCVLAGTAKMDEIINDSDIDLGQFNSRVVMRLNIAERSRRPRDPKPLYTIDEIVAMFGKGKLRLSTDGAQFLAMVANAAGIGSLRICSQLLRVAAGLRDMRERAITEKDLRRIMRETQGDAYHELTRLRAEQSGMRIAASA